MSKTLDNIDAIVTACKAITGITAEDVKLGQVWPGKGYSSVQINVMPSRETKEEIDGDEVHVTLELGVSCIVRIDVSLTPEQFTQLSTTWAKVEAKMETLIKNNNGGLAHKMQQDPSGAEWFGFTDKDSYSVAGACYIIEFERALGA